MNKMLQEKLKELARLNNLIDGFADDVAEANQKLEATAEYRNLIEVETRERNLKSDMAALRAEINILTLEAYQQTGEKKPAPGVGIRIYTNYKYDGDVALDYCRESLPEALKLDKRKFEKFVKGVQEVQPLDFVTIEEEPRPTISSDLSEYLEYNPPAQ